VLACALVAWGFSSVGAGRAKLDFFESKIRPVLVAECYDCHGPAKQKGGLRVDYRDGLLEGGSEGAAIVPGDEKGSLLIKTLRHEVADLAMPKDGAPLSDQVIRDFEKWIREGAVDPRDQPASTAEADPWETAMEFRKQWWSFQPIQKVDPPEVDHPDWNVHPVDKFLYARMFEKGLEPGGLADPEIIARRLSFVLTGLPPVAFGLDPSRGSVVEKVQSLMASEHYGERWARHWMDWMRYAESHGSEGDPSIPNAYRYRDYLIRAFNKDVSVDQLIREHIAGDLLPEPRLSDNGLINESRIGLAHFRMVQHGFQPTDALDELVRFTDDQIDVVSKAFLGLTVSCARCHNHKFDAISQEDYYALFGVFRSSPPGMVSVTPKDKLLPDPRMKDLKREVAMELAGQWLKELDKKGLPESVVPKDLKQLLAKEGEARAQAVEEFLEEREGKGIYQSWDLSGADYSDWYPSGEAWPVKPFAAGGFAIEAENEDRVLRGIYPSGVWTHSDSSKLGGILSSPRFKVEKGAVHVRLMGDDFAQARLVIQNYPIPRGGIYGQKSQPDSEDFKWYRWNTDYWEGEEVHVEVATFDDLTFFNPVKRGAQPDMGDGRSYIGIQKVVAHDGSWKPDERDQVARSFLKSHPEVTDGSVVMDLTEWTRKQIRNWMRGDLSDEGAEWLNRLLQSGALPNRPALSSSLGSLLSQYRAMEQGIPIAPRVPGVVSHEARDQRLYVRGDHRKPEQVVPRRFLEAFGARTFSNEGGGRLDLARQLVDERNPLTARVMVNRIWTKVFGVGLVDSVDNFGRLGQMPSHPELLDYLSDWFRENNWSTKALVQLLVTSRAFQLKSDASPRAKELDPGNHLLSHAEVRRLDAESIRDSLLAVSGMLDKTVYGTSVSGSTPRRSLYLQVKRNSLDPFLTTFDLPEPLSTRGKRDETNVPAQSLTLMNDPLVFRASEAWAKEVHRNEDSRIRAMIHAAFGRSASGEEVRFMKDFITDFEVQSAGVLASRREVQSEVARLSEERSQILSEARARLERRAEKKPAETIMKAPKALWDFREGLKDVVGGVDLQLNGDARLEAGVLWTGGSGYGLAKGLKGDLRSKSLLVELELTDLEQKAGGAISIQSPDGRVFDAIVYAERQSRHWLAGSNNHRRTKDFGGHSETEAQSRPVQLVMTWSEAGEIRLYRDGEPYGSSYRAEGPVTFKEGEYVMTLGLRHLPGVGNRFLKARIHKAGLFDHCLSPEEVAALEKSGRRFVSEKAILASLSNEEQARLGVIDSKLAELRAKVLALEAWGRLDEGAKYAHLAHALFNLKEFVFLK